MSENHEDTHEVDASSVVLPGGSAIPLVGFGTWQLSGGEARRAVESALEVGYRHIDTATGYRNENEVGAALGHSGLDRSAVFVTTKMPPDHASRERETLEQSLAALGLDWVDLWLVHWPPGGTAGTDSWRVFIAAREEGLVRNIGVSNYSLDQIDEIGQATGVAPAVNQIEWSPFRYDSALVQEHRARGVLIEGYSPFKASRLDEPLLGRIAGRYGKTPAQLIIRWHIQHGIPVLPRSARPERIRSNIDVFDFELSAEDMAALDGLARHS
jgi:2,5-diketo-D-gluconate reductase A